MCIQAFSIDLPESKCPNQLAWLKHQGNNMVTITALGCFPHCGLNRQQSTTGSLARGNFWPKSAIKV